MSKYKALIAKIGNEDAKNERIIYFKEAPSDKLVDDCLKLAYKMFIVVISQKDIE